MFIRLLKLGISFLYYIIDLLFLKQLRRQRRATIQVMVYHSIHENERQNFAKQMKTLVRLTRPLHVNEFELAHSTEHLTHVTFDDAYKNVVKNAIPELINYSIPATIFVPANYIGRRADWENRLHSGSNSEEIMSGKELTELPSELIAIGSHTVSHCDLTRLSATEAFFELKESRALLERLLGYEIHTLAFPYNAYNKHVLTLCKEAGYNRLFCSLPVQTNGYLTGRVNVSPRDWDWEFRLKILGYYRWHPIAVHVKQWLLKKLRTKKL